MTKTRGNLLFVIPTARQYYVQLSVVGVEIGPDEARRTRPAGIGHPLHGHIPHDARLQVVGAESVGQRVVAVGLDFGLAQERAVHPEGPSLATVPMGVEEY